MGTQTPKTQRYIAFLRAINVGGHTVKMDTLRKLFEGLGFSKVETFIASGNVIFESPPEEARTLEKKIESNLRESLGYEVATFLRTPAELAEIVNYRPFPSADLEAEGNWLYIAFLPARPDGESQQKLMAHRNPIDDFHIHEREMYWLRRRKIGESTFTGALLEKTLGMPATMRNITTVKKIAGKYGITKSELLEDLQEENQQWEALLAQIGEERMDQPGVAGQWSVKDIVAHLAGWRKRTVLRLQAARAGRGDPPPPWPPHLPTDDEINAWIYAANWDRSVSEVLHDSRQVFQQLLAAIEAFPEAELMDPNRFPWMNGEPMSAAAFFAHFHEEHEPDMRAWLNRVNDAPQ